MPATPIDIDAIIAEDREKAIKAVNYIPVTVLGKERRVSTTPNIYTALASGYGDVKALAKMIVGVVHPDDRDEFGTDLMEAEGIDATVLMKLLNAMVEAAAARPTKSPSASSRGSRKAPPRKLKSAAT